jgi:transcriptional regulator with XRE-family HTH domain
MINNKSLGEHIRGLREKKNLTLRKLAAALDIDPSTLSKIERGERHASKEMLPLIAGLFDQNVSELEIMLISDKVAFDLLQFDNHEQVLKVANSKIKLLKDKYL